MTISAFLATRPSPRLEERVTAGQGQANIMSRFRRLLRRFLLRLVVLAVAAGVGAFAVTAWKPAIAPIEPPAAAMFPQPMIARGATLAAIGDCAVCHTEAD